MLSLGQTAVGLGDRAARRGGWGAGRRSCSRGHGAHLCPHSPAGRVWSVPSHRQGNQEPCCSKCGPWPRSKGVIHWRPAGKWFWLPKHHQGGNGKSVRNAKSQALPRPAESALHIKIPHSKHLPKVTQLVGRGWGEHHPESPRSLTLKREFFPLVWVCSPPNPWRKLNNADQTICSLSKIFPWFPIFYKLSPSSLQDTQGHNRVGD